MRKIKRKKIDYSPLKSPKEFRAMQKKDLKTFKTKQKAALKRHLKHTKAIEHFRKTGKWPRGYVKRR